MFKLTAQHRKWITIIAMALLAAYSITSPIDLKSMLPAWVATPKIGQFSLVNIAAYLILIGVYWILKKDI